MNFLVFVNVVCIAMVIHTADYDTPQKSIDIAYTEMVDWVKRIKQEGELGLVKQKDFNRSKKFTGVGKQDVTVCLTDKERCVISQEALPYHFTGTPITEFLRCLFFELDKSEVVTFGAYGKMYRFQRRFARGQGSTIEIVGGPEDC